MTIKQKAQELGVQPNSLKKKLNRKGIKLGVNDQLTEEALAILGENVVSLNPLKGTPFDGLNEFEKLKAQNEELSFDNQDQAQHLEQLFSRIDRLKREVEHEKQEKQAFESHLQVAESEIAKLEAHISLTDAIQEKSEEEIEQLEELLAQYESKQDPWYIILINIMPNIMIGLAASFGVYHFSSHFMPMPFPLIEAAAFEFIYIRLTMMKNLDPDLKILARRVSLGAVAVSMVYNTISASMYIDPSWIDTVSANWIWLLYVLHGFPLALIGYYVVEVHFHEKK